MTKIYAYCWASGAIGFGNEVPEGALEIANSRNKKKLMQIIEFNSWCEHGEPWIVPLIRCMDNEDDKLKVLCDYSREINKRLSN